jgi:hypothetical protein
MTFSSGTVQVKYRSCWVGCSFRGRYDGCRLSASALGHGWMRSASEGQLLESAMFQSFFEGLQNPTERSDIVKEIHVWYCYSLYVPAQVMEKIHEPRRNANK